MFKRKKSPPPEPPKKRDVWSRPPSSGHWIIDKPLFDAINAAALFYDADEFIACLNDSPRFRRHLCKRAEERAEQLRKDLAAAEEAARKACRISQEDAP